MFRFLKWASQGYQPEGYEWHNYRPSYNSLALAHDLFEHQVGESGTWTEEFRAFGASVRFDTHKDNIVGRNGEVYARHFSKMLKGEPLEPKYFTEVSGFNSDINYFAYYLMYFHNPYYLRNILMSGYNHAQKFTNEAFQGVVNYDFKTAWQCEYDIEVSLITGNCKSIKI